MSPTTPVTELGLLGPARRLLLKGARNQLHPLRIPHNLPEPSRKGPGRAEADGTGPRTGRSIQAWRGRRSRQAG